MRIVCLIQEGDDGAVKIVSTIDLGLAGFVCDLQRGNPRALRVRACLAGGAVHADALRMRLARHAIVCADGSWFAADALHYLPDDLERVEHDLVRAA